LISTIVENPTSHMYKVVKRYARARKFTATRSNEVWFFIFSWLTKNRLISRSRSIF